MKELNIGDRLEYEDGRGAIVVGKYPPGYTLQWDDGYEVFTYHESLWQIDQEYLESCNMRIVKGV